MTSAEKTSSAQTASPPKPLLAEIDIRWLLAARICLLSVVLLATTSYRHFFAEEYGQRLRYLYTPIFVYFGISALSALWLRIRGDGPVFTYLQLLFDVSLITGIIYMTGGPISPFLFLYLPLVMAAAIMISRRCALITGGVAGATYTLLVVCMLQGWVSPADGSALVPVPAGGMVLQIVGLCSAMILIAVLTGYLARVARSSTVLLEQQKRALFELSNRQRSLIDGLSDGVITTTLEESILSVNQAAAMLLKIRESAVLGRSLAEVLHSIDNSISSSASLGRRPSMQGEFEVSSGSEHGAARVKFHAREIQDVSGRQTGLIFVFQDVTKLRSIEEQLALQERMARLLADKDGKELVTSTKLRDFVGESAVMQKVFNLIQRVAPSDTTILVSGESGTGKELVAKAIHLGSPRCAQPFIAVNCGAIPENLIESELFGHKKGSFTGADADYIGLFRQADGGTIFLDEIGELPLTMQTKLLRTIQERNVRPVGSSRDVPINVRIIAATNRNLRKEVDAARFREDLFYRLNVINVNLPSLRSRKEDLPLLINSIMKGLVDKEKDALISPAAMALLLSYNYPGNVRELENILERAVVLGSEVILPEHLPDSVIRYSAEEESAPVAETRIIVDEEIVFPIELDKLLADIERRYLEIALVRTQGAKKKAAELLGINFRSFRYRLQKFGLSDE